MNIKTFSIGGIHPEENKLTHEVATKVAALPKQAIFPLGQHIGAPAKPVVQKGDKVKVGTQIGKPMEKALSTSIFSSVSGTVLKVDTVVEASGYKKPAVYITVEGD
jgi:electron transport complex protein RnfC